MASVDLGDADYDVLNVVTVKKMTDPPAIANICGQPVGEVRRVLDDLAERGLVVVAAGSALPTNDAEPALAAAASVRYARVRTDGALLRLVERFEEVNRLFLGAMSAWQQVNVGGRKVANDHTDSGYDNKIITSIERLVRRLEPLLDALAAHDPRFDVYRDRFARTLTGIDNGDIELMSSPARESMHNIWFEFHEDLLRTLGRERKE